MRIVLAMENKKNEHFPSISDGALISQDDSGALGRVILTHSRNSSGEEPPNFLQKSDPRFKELHNVIDNLYCKLQGQGISIQV